MQSLVPVRIDGYLPIGQYAALGDGRSVALSGMDGSIDWLCVPDLDSPPVLDRLLDAEDGGSFRLAPVGPFEASRQYRVDSNVLETTFTTPGGRARVTESLNSGHAGRLPWTELARRVEGIEGSIEFAITFRTGAGLEESRPTREPTPNGDLFRVARGMLQFRAGEGVRMDSPDDRGLTASCTTSPGSKAVVALIAIQDGPMVVPSIESIDARIGLSDAQWRNWAADLRCEGPYAPALRRSALALKILLFSPSGAIAAAATTSLPERIGGPKNYDYRAAWVRDVAYSTKAFLRLGALSESKAAFAWLLNTIREHGPKPHVFYTLRGEPGPAATRVKVPGYRGSTPVQVGNDAGSQEQLSIYGDILETAALFVERGHVLDAETGELLAGVADRCVADWGRKDSGIWELETRRHYTMSKIGCWLALDRAADLAEKGHLDARHAPRWEKARDEVREYIDKYCWSEAKQSYTQYAGTEDLDAALLLASRFHFPRKDRLDLTRAAVQRELCRGPLVYRYAGMDRQEGAFLACSFWLVEAFAFLGHPAEARATLDELLAIAGENLGLYAEMIDPDTRESLGNIPQGLSHLAMIHAVLSLDEAKDTKRGTIDKDPEK